MMRNKYRHLLEANSIDDGVSEYDKGRVEDVTYSNIYRGDMDAAIRVFDAPIGPKDLLRDPTFGALVPPEEAEETPKPSPKPMPLEFMLPAGVNPHVPLKHLAKTCLDPGQGYGMGKVASLDTAKASRFDRATDTALVRLQQAHNSGALGFVFVVARYEDIPRTEIEGLRAEMTGQSTQKEQSGLAEYEEACQARIERLRDGVSRIGVPHMTLLTLEPFEDTPIFSDETNTPDINPERDFTS